MDDVIEIDLRKLILNLLANWKLIIGISFVLGLAAFLYSFLQPDIYQAKAVIAVTKPRYIANFDPQYQTVNTTAPTSKALLDVVNSDVILSQVYDFWQGEKKELVSFDNFRDNAIEASAGGDTSILVLKVMLENPNEAAALANQWAQLSVKRINSLYSGVDDNQLLFFDNQIEITTQNLDNAKIALEEFEARDQSTLISNELDSLFALQSSSLRKQRLLENARQDALGILQTLENSNASTQVVSQIHDNFKVLQLRLYADSGFEQSPLQLQLSNSPVGESLTVAQLRILINDWVEVLDDQYEELEGNTTLVEEQVLAYQQQLRKYYNQHQTLELQYKVIKDTYETLLRKQREVRISSDEHSGDAQVASQARVPEERMPHNTVRNTAIALVAGGILEVIFVILHGWFKEKNNQQAS
ncbi:MAG: hypothetical protein CVU40_10285 [Chloroflexi bacterium HGW-Chloroflexi-2]|jgi:uncharacterized protein involved in exopolysaccharide biosynthesis|nr:MAG: hypothetical protein CVU40_10285 [Chloroflexi bacterium HGW-Chloroflexi-2]